MVTTQNYISISSETFKKKKKMIDYETMMMVGTKIDQDPILEKRTAILL